MIQRIQSVYLFLVFALSIALVFIPIFQSVEGNVLIQHDVAQIGINLFTGITALLAVFMYKKRALQMKICFLGLLLSAVLAGFLLTEFFMASSAKFMFGLPIPIVNMVLLLLAYLGIKKDEKLVKSLDRLR